MVLLIVGFFFMALGLFSGFVLVSSTVAWIAWTPSLALWAFFPAFLFGGYLLFALGARVADTRRLTLILGGLLLALALTSATYLVLSAADAIAPLQETRALWYVLSIGGLSGIALTASHRKAVGKD